MKSKFVNNKFLSKYEECNYGQSSESTLYHDDEHILKIIKEEFLKDDRELIVKRLEELSHPSLVTPEFLLHDRTGFIGYGMEYCKDYYMLENLITNNINDQSIPFNVRKEIALKICELFNYLNQSKYSFYDIHDKNILINKDRDIKLIDLDSGIFEGTVNCNIDYHTSYIHSSRQLALFTLSFLYNMFFNEFERAFAHPFSYLNINKNEMLNNLPYKVRKYFEFVLSRKFYVFDETEECIDAFDEQTFNESIQILQKRL